MKPCAKNQKHLAWLALDTLDRQEAATLRAHIETCEGCRHYFGELKHVTQTLQATEVSTEIQPSEAFHRRVTNAIRAQEFQRPAQLLPAWFGSAMSDWRVALYTLGSAATVVALCLAPWPRGVTESANQPATVIQANFSPTLANYQSAADHSLEEFDELLTRQANRSPSYTSLTRAEAVLY